VSSLARYKFTEISFLGWICYAEKTHGSFILPYISTTKSAQQIMGSLVKGKLGRNGTYHITVMPCYDKKLEASRSEFFSKEENSKDVDCVITTSKLALNCCMEDGHIGSHFGSFRLGCSNVINGCFLLGLLNHTLSLSLLILDAKKYSFGQFR